MKKEAKIIREALEKQVNEQKQELYMIKRM